MVSEYSHGQKTIWINEQVDYPIEDRQKIGRMLQTAADVIDDMAKESAEDVATAVVVAIEQDLTFEESWGTLKAEPPEKKANKNTEATP